MRTSQLFVAGTIILALLATANGWAAAQDEAAEVGGPTSILFVGNSYTYYHGGLERQVVAMAADDDPPRAIVARAETAPDMTLKAHHQVSAPESRYGALDAIREADHDVVVLQEYIPFVSPKTVDTFLEYARLFDAEIKDAGAETVFFMTWPLERVDWIDLDGMVAAHRQVEAELGARIAPVGVAMDRALDERPDLAMLAPDGKHPSAAGSYLAGATIYATLFDRSPEGLASDYDEDVTPEDAAFLQRIAWETVQEWEEGSPPAE